jgi:predicted restriction endonuclease
MKRECKKLLQELQEIKAGKSYGTMAPHKAVLLLTVLDLIEEGVMTLHQIKYDDILKSGFRRRFNEIIGIQKNISVAEPFWHLRTSSFWVHRVRTEMAELYDATSTSGGGDKRIKEMIEYASFAYYARRALMDKDCLKCVRESLLTMCNERKIKR